MIERYGRLTLIGVLPNLAADGHVVARWKCDCGSDTTVPLSRVRNGYTKSCGCMAREARATNGRTHGGRNTSEYRSWQAMLQRCSNQRSKDYPRWGGAGITVYPEWASSFSSFAQHIGPRPQGTTLDRIDPTRGYEPGNVRWATPKQQARNRRDIVRVSTAFGVMDLVDYASLIGLTKGAAHLRLKRGTLEGVTRV